MHFVAAQRHDQAFDVPPVAKAGDIPVVAAPAGARGRFDPGALRRKFDQLGGIGQRGPAIDEGRIHAPFIKRARFATADKYRQHVVDHVIGSVGGIRMADIFVSYKAEDRRRVKPLVEALQADGFSVWWDEQIGGGAAWRHAIETELNAAKCVIVAWSKRSVGAEGTFVQDEATRAQQRHVYIPVTIDKVHLPLGFGETQALPLTGWHGDRADPHYQAVLAAVQRNVGGKRRRTPASVSGPRVDRRTMIGGGAVATVVVAGVGAWALLKPGSASASSNSIAVLPFQNSAAIPAKPISPTASPKKSEARWRGSPA